MTSNAAWRGGIVDRIGRKLVQLGFLALFLYPLVPTIIRRLTFQPMPVLTSWLLPWDPLLFIGHLVQRNWSWLVIGAPLLLLALTMVMGRFFCGWVCPLGTLFDLVRPIARWQKREARKGRLPAAANSPVRYYLLVAALAGGAVSLKLLGTLDPLVIFHRAATVLASDVLALERPVLRVSLSVSFVFLGVVALELVRPRFWCRHLCPVGALLGLFARRSLLVRRVSDRCNQCGACRRYCPMNAIPAEAHDTAYSECHMCFGCEGVCPRGAISFKFGGLAGKRWQSEGKVAGAAGKARLAGQYVSREERLWGLTLSRRGLFGGLVAGAAGLALSPALRLTGQGGVIRPPGALPEDEFVRKCILCQECVRVCPTSGIKPILFEAGIAAVGTPQVVPREGGCTLSTSCTDLCAQVCPVGAIRPMTPERMKLGIAVVDHPLCLAWDQGVKCLVCVEACPTGAAQVYSGRVTIDLSRCTGCGRCESACPIAGAAIHVRPL